MVTTTAAARPCRMTNMAVQVVRLVPRPWVAIPFSEAAALGPVLDALARRDGHIVPAGVSAAYPLCRSTPKVTYGRR